MALLTAASSKTARRLLIVGVATYRPGWTDIAEAVAHEVATVKEVFTRDFGYEQPSEVSDPDRTQLTDGVADWFGAQTWGEHDLAVVYYTGHAVARAASSLELITSDLGPDETHKATDAPDLAKWIWAGDQPPCRHVLLILDTCQSEAGGSPILGAAKRIQEAAGGQVRAGEFHVIATARSVEDAGAGLFAERFRRVVRKVAAEASADEFLNPGSLIKAINNAAGSDPRQHASITGRTEGEFLFFPNPCWDPHLRPDMDRNQRQRVLARLQTRALTTHWEPRARGVSVESEPGWYFTGREALLRDLATWSRARDQAGRLVIGRPGSGKSTVLSWVAYMSDSACRASAVAAGALDDMPDASVPEAGAINLAVHARAKTSDEVLLEMVAGLGLEIPDGVLADDTLSAVVEALHALPRAVVVIVDALDEAGNPHELASSVRFLTEQAGMVRFLVGVRRGDPNPGRLISRLGSRFELLDLDSPAYSRSADIEKYVTRYLLNGPGTPYRLPQDASLIEAIAREAARRAGHSFLIAAATSHALASRTSVAASSELQRLPADVGQAFDAEFARFAVAERAQATAVLTALSFAEGGGLPHSLWAPVAAAISSCDITEDDVAYWLGAAEFYIATDDSTVEPVHRLYHEEFARHLRDQASDRLGDRVAQRRIVAVLSALVDSQRGWQHAHPYIRRHFADHAEKSGELSDYAEDPSFLAGVEPTALMAAAGRPNRDESDDTRWVRRLLMLVGHHIRDENDAGERASHLQFAARQLGDDPLAEDLAAVAQLAWETDWVHMARDLSSTLLRSGASASQHVCATAVIPVDGQPLVVAAWPDGSVRRWDLAAGAERLPAWTVPSGESDRHTRARVVDIATVHSARGPIAVVALDNGTIHRWDLLTGAALQPPIQLPNAWPFALAATDAPGDATIYVGIRESLYRWTADTGETVGLPDEPRDAWISTLAVCTHEGCASLLVGRHDGMVERLDLQTLRPLEVPVRVSRDRVESLSTGTIDEQPALVATDRYERAHVWTLDPLMKPLHSVALHSAPQGRIAITTLNGRPTLVAATAAIELRDLASGELVGQFLGHEGTPTAVAAADVDGDPVIVSGGVDGTVRSWDPRDASLRTTADDRFSPASAVASGYWPANPSDQIVVAARGQSVIELRQRATGHRSHRISARSEEPWLRAVALAGPSFGSGVLFSDGDSRIQQVDPLSGLVTFVAQALVGNVMDMATVPARMPAVLACVVEGQIVRRHPVDGWLPAARDAGSVREVSAAEVAGKCFLLALDAEGVLIWHLSDAVANKPLPPGRRIRIGTPGARGITAVDVDGDAVLVVGAGYRRAVHLYRVGDFSAGDPVDAEVPLLRDIPFDAVVNDVTQVIPDAFAIASNKGVAVIRLTEHVLRPRCRD